MKVNCQRNAGKSSGFAHIHQLAAGLALAAGLFTTGCATTHPAPPPTSKVQQSALTSSQALAKLEAGNARFVAGKPLHREWPQQRDSTAAGQYQFAHSQDVVGAAIWCLGVEFAAHQAQRVTFGGAGGPYVSAHHAAF